VAAFHCIITFVFTCNYIMPTQMLRARGAAGNARHRPSTSSVWRYVAALLFGGGVVATFLVAVVLVPTHAPHMSSLQDVRITSLFAPYRRKNADGVDDTDDGGGSGGVGSGGSDSGGSKVSSYSLHSLSVVGVRLLSRKTRHRHGVAPTLKSLLQPLADPFSSSATSFSSSSSPSSSSSYQSRRNVAIIDGSVHKEYDSRLLLLNGDFDLTLITTSSKAGHPFSQVDRVWFCCFLSFFRSFFLSS
jgi:hypothetical protein